MMMKKRGFSPHVQANSMSADVAEDSCTSSENKTPDPSIATESISLINHDNSSSQRMSMTRKTIVKNVILLSASNMLLSGAFKGLQTIQSSLLSQQGMGVYTQSISYGTAILASLFLPHVLISLVGHKWCVVISYLGYALWMAANAYAVWVTMVVGSVLCGLAKPCVTCAICVYLTIAAQKYASESKASVVSVTATFFAILQGCFRLSEYKTYGVISDACLVIEPFGRL